MPKNRTRRARRGRTKRNDDSIVQGAGAGALPDASALTQVNPCPAVVRSNDENQNRMTAMFRDLLVPTTTTDGGDNAIDAGIALAGVFEARLTVLQLVNLPRAVMNPWGLMPGGLMPDVAMSDVYSRLRAQGEINVGRIRNKLDKQGVPSEVRMVETALMEPAGIAAHHAHYADLAIVAGARGDSQEASATTGFVGALLLESGRPVLVVPPGYKLETPADRILLAWRPTREAARAIHDAMPFLQRATRVDVAVVDAVGDDLAHGSAPGADVAAHLADHGIEANLVRLDSGQRSVGATLLEQARGSAAQMIVAGGYGHSRVREWALGGTTRDLLTASSIPVLLSH